MTTATILFADNAPEFLKIRTEFLEADGYRIIPAINSTEARRLLERGGIDLAILDIRLDDDEDEKDISGLTLAKEASPSIPKIILTSYPTVDMAREALKPQLDGLPAAVEFIDKHEGIEALKRAVERALGPDSMWLRKVKQAIDGTDSDIWSDHKDARQQSYILFMMTVLAVVLGTSLLFLGIFLASSGKLDVVIASTIGGIITNTIGYLFFQRVDLANKRMDQYHEERVEGQRFQTLLQACDALNSKQEREFCRKQVILTATQKWIDVLKNSQE